MKQITEMDCIAPLFAGWQETLIYSCLQGHMGSAYASDENEAGVQRDCRVKCAQLVIADFCFFAGEAQRELTAHKPEHAGDFIIMVPGNEKWAEMIEQVYGEKARRVTRYAIKKEPDVFDRCRLEALACRIPKPFQIQRIDRRLYQKIMEAGWSRDLCAHFADAADYEKRGIGYAALLNGEVVAGASSYTVYSEGIEIEIDTREEYRRKGLALLCGANLILACLKKGLYPSWDAQNKGSVALAEKLGYHFDHAYTAYEVMW